MSGITKRTEIENQSNKCVHTEHCCLKHGCKYMHDDCPVANGTKKQSFDCWDCESDQRDRNNKASNVFMHYKVMLVDVNNYHSFTFIWDKRSDDIQVIQTKTHNHDMFYICGNFNTLKFCTDDNDRKVWFQQQIKLFLDGLQK